MSGLRHLPHSGSRQRVHQPRVVRLPERELPEGVSAHLQDVSLAPGRKKEKQKLETQSVNMEKTFDVQMGCFRRVGF